MKQTPQFNSFLLKLINPDTGLITIDENSSILFANARAHYLFGYDPGELTGQSLTVLMEGEVAGRHLAAFSRYRESGRAGMSWENVRVPARRKDGSMLDVMVTFVEIRIGNSRQFTGIVDLATD